ncbi:hypothetical protein CPAV1605_445 [seawater metagenome]|uniref:Uncharacterized protein n=1 Tax=seawater metagenome TaxID=1561972 RepID=A0A5E8CM14_9ZZZZ
MEVQGGEKPITEESQFEVLLIRPNTTSHFDFNDTNYLTNLINMDCIESIATDSTGIAKIFAEKLNPKNLPDCIAVTNICYEGYDKLYELCFLDGPNTEKIQDNYNELANILDITEEKIYGNAILLKTNLPVNDYSMKLVSSQKNDIRTILEARLNHKGVFIDDQGEMKEMMYRDINTKLKELFGDLNDVTKYEIPFLKHNFTMYYVKNSYDNENKLVANIAQNNINGDVFITSMLTPKLFTDITCQEVNQMLAISKYGPDAWQPAASFDEKEKDNLDRNIIKSRFRILNQKYQQILQNQLALD